MLRPGRLPVVDRGGSARTTPLVTAARGATGFINGLTEFDPGASIPEHTHNVAESVMIVHGRATVEIDGALHELSELDTTFIPANVAHPFANASAAEPMTLFWTYGSIDATRTTTATGDSLRIDEEHAGVAATPPIVRQTVDYRVVTGEEADFEAAVGHGVPLFQHALGARAFRLERFEHDAQRYRLTITWETLDDHVSRFLGSPAQRQWHELVERHLVAPPDVAHVSTVLDGF